MATNKNKPQDQQPRSMLCNGDICDYIVKLADGTEILIPIRACVTIPTKQVPDTLPRKIRVKNL